MGLWLGNNRNRLKNMNDFMAREIIKCLDKRKLSFYDKLDELYDKFYSCDNIRIIPPASFLDMINLEKSATMIMTDSGSSPTR